MSLPSIPRRRGSRVRRSAAVLVVLWVTHLAAIPILAQPALSESVPPRADPDVLRAISGGGLPDAARPVDPAVELGEKLLAAMFKSRRAVTSGQVAIQFKNSSFNEDGLPFQWTDNIECEFVDRTREFNFQCRRSDRPNLSLRYRESPQGVDIYEAQSREFLVFDYAERHSVRPPEFFDPRTLGLVPPSEMRSGVIAEIEKRVRETLVGIRGETTAQPDVYRLETVFAEGLIQQVTLVDAARDHVPLRTEVRYRLEQDQPWGELKQLVEITWERVNKHWVPAKAETTFHSATGHSVRHQVYVWLDVNHAPGGG